jgi:hypothetical protein
MVAESWSGRAAVCGPERSKTGLHDVVSTADLCELGRIGEVVSGDPTGNG